VTFDECDKSFAADIDLDNSSIDHSIVGSLENLFNLAEFHPQTPYLDLSVAAAEISNGVVDRAYANKITTSIHDGSRLERVVSE
jgi:hypothetical protein